MRSVIRRSLLWILPVVGGLVGFGWGIWDLQLITDLNDAGFIVVPQNQCRKNLSRILDAAHAQVQKMAEDQHAEQVPSQPDCWQRLVASNPEIAALECQLVSYSMNTYQSRGVPFSPDLDKSYSINPRLFTRPAHHWKDTDIVAVDSRPRHFADLRGPRIRCVQIVTWDRSLKIAHLDNHQEAAFVQQLNDFAAGVKGLDSDESWRQFYEKPRLELTWSYFLVLIHLAILGTIAIVWTKLLRAGANPRTAVSPSEKVLS